MTTETVKSPAASEQPRPDHEGHPGHPPHEPAVIPALELPYIDRLGYFYGQMLTERQLKRAQASIYERANLHNRALHGWGTVCGLEVTRAGEPPAPPCPCPPHGAERAPEKVEEPHAECNEGHEPCCPPHPHHRVHVHPGMAIDPHGDELVLRAPLSVDLIEAMSREDRFAFEAEKHGRRALYLSLVYAPFGIDPADPMTQDACGMPSQRQFTMWRDGVRARVTLRGPTPPENCGAWWLPSCSRDVLLARIECDLSPEGLRIEHIDNTVRRRLAPYVPTVITGVSWRHGHHYDHEEVDHILWKEGVRVRFSRPVHTHTLKPGVFDVFLYEMGAGRSSQVRALRGEFVGLDSPMTHEFTYRLKNEEHSDPGDRVVFVLRGDFVLDGCGRAVDANNIGGRVPWLGHHEPHGAERLPDDERHAEPEGCEPCAVPPGHLGRWTSGNGVLGGTFESWIMVSRHDRSHSSKEGER